MGPATSLARVRKQLLDRVARGDVTVVRACGEAEISTSWFYELPGRFLAYGRRGCCPSHGPYAPIRPATGARAPDDLSASGESLDALHPPNLLHNGQQVLWIRDRR